MGNVHQPETPAHGTRKCYQAGCRALQCRAANAAYQAAVRRLRAEGKLPLRATMPAGELWKMVKALKVEDLNYAQIAVRLGLRTPILQFDTSRVTVRNYLKVRQLYQALMAEGPDHPLGA